MRRAWRALLALHGTFAAQIALVAVWLGPKPLPRYARATCASLQFNTDATLVLVVDDKAIVPRECLDHARVWEVGADGVAKGLGEAAARALRLDPPSAKATREKIVGALRRMPSLVIELKPLWVYAWRERLMREGFDRATFADLDVVWGDVKRVLFAPPPPLQTTRKRGKGPPSKKSKATAAGPPSWTRGDVQLRPTRATLRGLNVQRPWAPMLLDGSKVIETRTYDIDKQKCFANEWFWVVETPGKKRQRGQRAHITGCIKFSSESVRYTSLAQWRADEDKHRIPAGSEYDWNGRGAMYGWRVEGAYALRSPLPRPDPKGVINSKPVTRTVPRGGWLA